MKKKLVMIFLLMSVVILANNKKSIEIKVNTPNVTLKTPFEMEVVLNNINDIKDLKIHNIEKFEILNRSTSKQTSIINGKMTKTTTYNYVMSPKEIGKFLIYAQGTEKNKKYKSNIQNIKVEKNSKNPKESSKQRKNPLEIITELSDDEIYFGEKVILAYNLYREVNIQNSGFTDNLEFDNFIAKDLEPGKSRKHYDENGNLKAITDKVAKKVLKPTKTGDLHIPEFNFQVNISSGDSFFGNTQRKYLKTQSKKIKVLELPEEKPENFKGIIGKLNINTSYSDTRIDYGDAITLKVKLFGNSNLDGINEIIGSDLENFKVYETVKKDIEKMENNNYYAEKEIEVILVPKKVGELIFPEISIPYFNKSSSEYQFAKINSFKIDVRGEKKVGNNQSDENQDVSQEKIVISQIDPVERMDKEYYTLRVKKEFIKWIFFVITIIILVFLITIIFIKINNKEEDEYKKIFLKYKDADEYRDFIGVLNEMVKYKFGISVLANSKNKIKNSIQDNMIYNIIEHILDKDKKQTKELKKELKKFYNNTKDLT
ncbi:MAG: BatD family protein [Fusobacteriota bacterium]